MTAMEKLKLSAVPDDKPVKLAVELPAAVHRDLMAYARGENNWRSPPGSFGHELRLEYHPLSASQALGG
jgi:hypothetical protein